MGNGTILPSQFNKALAQDKGPGNDYSYLANLLLGNQSGQGANGHYSDVGKLPNHPTFSNESAFSTLGQEGGSWAQDNGKWIYSPTQGQMKVDGYKSNLADYFNQTKGEGIDGVVFPPPYKGFE